MSLSILLYLTKNLHRCAVQAWGSVAVSCLSYTLTLFSFSQEPDLDLV